MAGGKNGDTLYLWRASGSSSSAAAPAARWSPTGCAGVSTPTRPRSTSSTATTATSTSPACSSSRSGSPTLDEIVRPRRRQLHDGIVFHERRGRRGLDSSATRCCSTTARCSPTTCSSSPAASRLQPEETEGLTGPGWNERVFTFYTPEGAAALRAALERFDGGRLVVNLVDMPIKCPVAPLEFAFLADWYFRERGIRDRVELVFSTPLDGAFTKPVASEHLGRPARREGDRARHRVQRRRGRRRRRQADLLRRPRARLRPARHRPAARRRRVRRALARPRRRARLRPDRQAHAADDGAAERVRARRRDRPADLEGRLRHALRGRGADRERRPLPRRRGARRRLRRPRELLHRDRLPQGAADRLQLRHRAAAGPLPDRARRCRCCASRGSTTSASSMFQWVYWHALLPGRDIPGIGADDADRRQEARRHCERKEDEMTMTLIADAPVDVDAEGFLTDPEQWNEQIAEAIARRERHPRADRPALAGRPVHARALPRDGHRALDPRARQGVRRPGQGALRSSSPRGRPSSPPRSAASPSPRAASRKEHDDDRADSTHPAACAGPSRRRSRRSRSSSRRARSRGSIPG